jgi:hypothetical protein
MYFSKNLHLLSALHLLSPTTSEAQVGREIRRAVRTRRLGSERLPPNVELELSNQTNESTRQSSGTARSNRTENSSSSILLCSLKETAMMACDMLHGKANMGRVYASPFLRNVINHTRANETTSIIRISHLALLAMGAWGGGHSLLAKRDGSSPDYRERC